MFIGFFLKLKQIRNDQNYPLRLNAATYCNPLRLEFDACFQKMNYYPPNTIDAPVWQTILPLRNDVLDRTIYIFNNDLHRKLFH